MARQLPARALVVAFATVAACRPDSRTVDADLAFVNVNVVDVAAGRVEPGQTVAVKGDRIVAVGPSLNLVPNARTVDGLGRYLIPGLMDMHTHLSAEHQLYLYLAGGVTTVRHMAGDSLSLRWRAATASGAIVGPRIVTAGPLIDGKPRIWAFGIEVTDPAAIDTMILAQKRAGYDFVKVYSRLTPAVFDAIIAAAKKYDIEVSGHVPQAVPLAHAISSGMRTGEHFIGVMKAVLRDTTLASPDLAAYDPRAREVVLAVGSGTLSTTDLIDSAKVAALGAMLAGAEFWLDPTHDIMRNFTSRPIVGHPDVARFVSPGEHQMLSQIQQFFGLTPAALAGEDSLYRIRTSLVAALHRRGARIIAGTDNATHNAWALKDEIRALSAAGLGNAAALRAATLEPAAYLGKRGELGEVKTGAIADLVLLAADPLENLEALSRPEGVVARGVWRSAADFAPRLDSIAQAQARQTSPNLGPGTEK